MMGNKNKGRQGMQQLSRHPVRQKGAGSYPGFSFLPTL